MKNRDIIDKYVILLKKIHKLKNKKEKEQYKLCKVKTEMPSDKYWRKYWEIEKEYNIKKSKIEQEMGDLASMLEYEEREYLGGYTFVLNKLLDEGYRKEYIKGMADSLSKWAK